MGSTDKSDKYLLIGQAQVDTITAAGLALKEAGVLPAATDVKAAVDSLVDRRFAATN